MKSNHSFRRFSGLAVATLFIFLAVTVQAQTHPNLFQRRPGSAAPGRHGLLAALGDVDESTLTAGASGLTIAVPGEPDLEFDRHSEQRRGPRSMVWRGQGQLDRSNVTLTLHEGLLYGRIESGGDIFAIQIVLMSVYTPQARAAAGGTAEIQAQIQAAVDQANTAFINSNMIARYFLSRTEEVASTTPATSRRI